MRYSVIMAIVSVILCSCESVFEASNTVSEETTQLVRLAMAPVVTPIEIQRMEIYDSASNTRKSVDVRALDAETIRRELTAYTTFSTIEKESASGSFTYLLAGGSVEQGTYRVTFDYVNYKSIPLEDNEGNSLGLGQIGVGLRVVATINSSSGNVNLAGLLPIGLAAEAEDISGGLSIEVLGVTNDKIPLSIPDFLELDANGVKEAFQAAAKIRLLFVDSETEFTPYLIGVSDVPPDQALEAQNTAKAQVTSE